MSEFNSMINKLRSEITMLKTTKVKSSSTLKTKSTSTSLTFNLKIDGGGASVYSDKRAVLTLQSDGENNFLSSLTLDLQSVDGRTYSLSRRVTSSGAAQFVLFIATGNFNDWQTIYSGGSVTVNLGATVNATADFALNVTYEDNDLG